MDELEKGLLANSSQTAIFTSLPLKSTTQRKTVSYEVNMFRTYSVNLHSE